VSAGPAATPWSARAEAYAASDVHARGASLARLLEVAAPRPGERAVDLGCGAGHTGARLADAGCEVVAVDLDPEMLAAATSRCPALVPCRADAAATGLQAGAFDLACARHTLHHHDDPDATLREARRLLRPGGRVVLVDESALPADLNDWYERLERTRDPDHRGLRDATGWVAALRAAGFVDVAVEPVVRERIDVAAWLDRVGAPEARRREVRRLLREAPEGADAVLRIERDAAGDAHAFAMPMVVASGHAPRPTDPDPPDQGEADQEEP
jgi:SAM-dependent methyltransferase